MILFLIMLLMLIAVSGCFLYFVMVNNKTNEKTNKIDEPEGNAIERNAIERNAIERTMQRNEIANSIEQKQLYENLINVTCVQGKEQIEVMYQMIADINSICRTHNIEYWVNGGGILVILRGGDTHIPWDDDFDINMVVEDARKFTSPAITNELSRLGYYVSTERQTLQFPNIIRIYPNNFHRPWGRPMVWTDVFVVGDYNADEYYHSLFSRDINVWDIHRWSKKNVHPIQWRKYGTVEVMCANNMEAHLQYGGGHLKLTDVDKYIVYAPHNRIMSRIYNLVKHPRKYIDPQKIWEHYARISYAPVDDMGILPNNATWNEWLSYYFAFQWVPYPDLYQRRYWNPRFFSELETCPRTEIIHDAVEGAQTLRRLCEQKCKGLQRIGVLLSSGVDSGSLAYCLPSQTDAFYVRYVDGETEESLEVVQRYAIDNQMQLHIIDISWNTYCRYTVELMKQKRAPLHPVEIPIYIVLMHAQEMGIEVMFAGWGCDTYFGGMDKLLSRDYHTVDDFKKRYTYLDPSIVLKHPIMSLVDKAYESYYDSEHGVFNTQSFLTDNYHGMTLQSFYYLADLVDMDFYCPWGSIGLPGGVYDIEKVRGGQPKYMVTDVFKELTKGRVPITSKIPFTRPDYICNPQDIHCPLFKDDIPYELLTKQQKWMLFMAAVFYEITYDRSCMYPHNLSGGRDISLYGHSTTCIQYEHSRKLLTHWAYLQGVDIKHILNTENK